MENNVVVIKLADGHTLPCGILTSEDPNAPVCGRPASALHCVQALNLIHSVAGLTPGEWVVLPVCAKCARAMREVYADD